MRNFIIGLALLSSACTYIEGEGESQQEQLNNWCESHFCMKEATVFTAAGEGIYDMLKPALERYQDATGRSDLSTDPQAGIPVIWVDNLKDDEGNDACGITVVKGLGDSQLFTQLIKISTTKERCPDPSVTLLHELIHALAPDADHLTVEGRLFSVSSGEGRIDEPSLTRLCTFFDCYAFTPESKIPQVARE